MSVGSVIICKLFERDDNNPCFFFLSSLAAGRAKARSVVFKDDDV